MISLRSEHLQATQREFSAALTLPGAVYSDAEIFSLEQQGLYGSQWVCVAHLSALPARGAYVVRQIGRESIAIVRGDDDSLRAFHNVCRHRGSRLLDNASGSGLARITCPYHAWSYQLDGRLLAAPQAGAQLDRPGLCLLQVQLDTHAGLIFVNLDSNAVPLAECLRELPDLSRFKIPALKIGRRLEYDVAANWKLICENYSECYHCPGAHPQLHQLTELIGRNERPMEVGACFNGGPMRLRDGITTMSSSGQRQLPLLPGLSAAERRQVHYYVVYPNLLLSPHPDYVMMHTLWPRGPGRTQVICEWLVTDEALSASAPAYDDVIGFWDRVNREDWVLCERTQLGVSSSGYRPGPYQTAEDCVHMFDRWYADRLAALL